MPLEVYYTHDEVTSLREAIFLAGPTERGLGFQMIDEKARPRQLTAWRQTALDILKELEWQGQVFIPEPYLSDMDEEQKDWEFRHLVKASAIAVWLPRGFDLVGLVTQLEFGFWLGREPKKVVYGRPESAKRIASNDFYWTRIRGSDQPIHTTLEDTLRQTIHVASWPFG